MSSIPRRTAAAWCVFAAVAVLSFPLQSRLDRSITATSSVAGTESAEVDRRLHTDFASPFAEPALLVVTGLAHAADSDSGRAAMRDIMAPILASHAVVAAISPGSALDTLLVGADHTTAIAIVGLSPRVQGAMDSVRAITAAHTSQFRRDHPAIVFRWTGEPALVGDLRAMGAREARRAELRALPVTVVVSIVAFGSVAGAGLAVGAAALAIMVALSVTGALSGLVPASTFTRTLVPLLGLALTVDYALFLRRRSLSGADPRAVRRTIFLAAAVVAIGFIGLAIAPTGELRSAALAGVVTCAVAALAAVMLTPIRANNETVMPPPHERWVRWANFVTRHPVMVLAASAVPLVLLAGAARTARLVTPLDQLLPPHMESADAFRDLERAGRAGAAASVRVLLQLPSGTPVLSPEGWAALKSATHTLRETPGAVDARSFATLGTGDLTVSKLVFSKLTIDAYVSGDGSTSIIDVIPDMARGDTAVLQLVRTVRGLDAARASGVAGARFLVSGLPAYVLDYQTALRSALPWIVVATSVATLVALLIAFRAPVVAFKAVALNLLVAAAAIGATVLVFQDGYGARLIGQHRLGSIFPTVPALAFGAAFGTSMDYELFLLGGVREALRNGLGPTESIIAGLARTGGLITRAAAVMACLFLAFSTSALLPLAMVGFALAVAVMLDATLVRLALAPALLRIAGRWNWWPNP